LLLVLALSLSSAPASAQPKLASLSGRVLTDSAELPIRGAEILIPQLRLTVLSDSAGSFLLGNIPSGRQLVMVRRVGFQPVSQPFMFGAGAKVEADFLLLKSAQTLPRVNVTGKSTSPRLMAFELRREQGLGHFLTTADLDKAEGRAMADVLNSVPTLRIYRSNVSSAAWAGSGRGQQSVGGVFQLDQYDTNRGAPGDMCYAAVFLDNNPIFTGRTGQLLFDMNTLDPKQIGGIEVYGGNSTIPPEFQRGGNTCGAVVIWTR
jgi:hypothetical protein